MKKLIGLVLILVIPAIVLIINNTSYSLRDLASVDRADTAKLSKYSAYRFIKEDSLRVSRKLKNLDPNWEYVKNKLFNHDFENRKIYSPDKFKGPILIVLKNATQKDSMAFDDVMKELREVITSRPIAYFSDFTGTNFKDFKKSIGDIENYSYQDIISSTINFTLRANYFMDGDTMVLDKYSGDHRGEKWMLYDQTRNWDILTKHHKSYDKRRELIQYKLLRALCFIYPLSSRLGRFRDYPSENVFTYGEKNFMESHGVKFTEMDKFLLAKLYSDDFEEQFRSYIYKAYSWRYASYFINPNIAKLKAFTLIFPIAVLSFVLSFGFFQKKKFKYSYLNYLYPCLFISMFLGNFISIYLFVTNMNLTRSSETLFASYIIAIAFAFIYSLLLWGIEKIVIKKELNFTYQLTLKTLNTFIILNLPLLIGIYIIENTTKSYFRYTTETIYLPIFISLTCLSLVRGLLIYLNYISQALVNEKDVELSRLKEINAQSELKLLQSHINPHFLYNALNSIAGLAHNDADKTEKMALSLSDLFRYSINKKGEKMSTVEEEVTMVQNYLEIEKIRFGDRLTFLLTIDETIVGKNIPMYILQPLVENAIKHGVSKIGGDAKISLEIFKEQDNLLIVVSDNGPEFPKGLVSGHGLQTVNDLLRLSYGNNASLKWENTPEKKITITITQID